MIFFTEPTLSMLADEPSYDEFSNTRNASREDDDHNNTGSLEGIHNTMHRKLVCLTR